MTKYEIKKVIGTSKEGREFKALQIVAHTNIGDYTSSYIFPSSFRPAQAPDWFGDSSSDSSLTDIYKDSEFSL